jgi:hypothetical protein
MNVVEYCHAFFCQDFKDLRVMNERTVGVNGALLRVGGVEDYLNSPADPHAKTCCLGELKLHRHSISKTFA